MIKWEIIKIKEWAQVFTIGLLVNPRRRKVMNKNFFEELEKKGIKVDSKQKAEIKKRLDNVINYVPRIGIMGKTGVGKSSLCNALFGMEVCEISDVEACTRREKEVSVNIGKKGLKLIDVPGVGESEARNKEYSELYTKLIPELDLILWVIKGDDRAHSEDETFYNNIIKPYEDEGNPFLFVLNQVDKIEPFREWDEKKNEPGNKQYRNISRKIESVATFFGVPASKIIGVSANEKYNLTNLVDEIVHILPKDKVVAVAKNIPSENISEKANKQINKTFWEVTGDVISDVVRNARESVETICDTVKSLGEKILDKMDKLPVIGRLFSIFS